MDLDCLQLVILRIYAVNTTVTVGSKSDSLSFNADFDSFKKTEILRLEFVPSDIDPTTTNVLTT